MAETCTHERTRFPSRPVPDAWYRCPDCGERVGKRGGRIITVKENNRMAAAQRPENRIASLEAERDRYKEALEEVLRIYHDDSLSNAQAQDCTAAVARSALSPDTTDEAT